MTVTLEETPLTGPFYSINKTEDKGRGAYACQRIPAGTTVHIAYTPFVSVIKEKFKKEVCAWCFKYQHCKNCPVKHPDTRAGVWFCSVACLKLWTQEDFDGKLTEALTSLRTNTARKYVSSIEDFPLDQAKLVASAIVKRSTLMRTAVITSSWEEVLDLQSGVFDDEIDLPSEVKQITPFLKQNLPPDLTCFVESTAYPFLSRHLSNSFGIWELPVSPHSENLGSAMYPSASYFNHSCDPNIEKVRQGRIVVFITSKEVQLGEELCISYGHTERQVEERRQVLRDWWGFKCDCSKCIGELEFLEGSLERQSQDALE